MSNYPEIKTDELNHLLRQGKIDAFNTRIDAGDSCDLTSTDFRGLHLQGLIADGLDFSNSYFRQTDLRGIDFSNARLDGASIHGARIAGCRFPQELSADEINLSLVHGTRLRYGR